MSIRKNKRQQVYSKTNNTCWYCRKKLTAESRSIDHLIPRSEGGSNDLSNLVPCCRDCNNKKASKKLTDLSLKEITG